MDSKQRVIRDGAIHIEDGTITEIGTSSEVKSRSRTNDLHINAQGMILLPNLINAHTHTLQTLRRGWGADLDLTSWLQKVIWPLNPIISPDDMALGARISAAEAIKSGSTFLLDNTTIGSSVESIKRMADAYIETGIKAGIAVGVTARTRRAEIWKIPKERFPYTIEESVRMLRDIATGLADKRKDGIHIWAAPVTIFSAGLEAYRAAWSVCEELDLGLHTHIAETTSEVESTLEDYSCREAEFLHNLGVLGHKTTLAHCIWLNDHEMDLLSSTKTNVVHNPICNMYLGSGIANVPALLQKGVNVALGSDGGTCGSSHDMLGVMKAAALVNKVRDRNPAALSSYQVLEMATIRGARAVGMDSLMGSIEIGKSADVFLLNLKKLHSAPVGDLFSSIVYYASQINVEYVLVNGKLVAEHDKLLTLDEEKLLEDSQRRADEIEARVASLS
jgi:5-methylthioadenosine/S-adenosylhomocysteine deaminase